MFCGKSSPSPHPSSVFESLKIRHFLVIFLSLHLLDMQSYGHLWLWVLEFVCWAVEVEKNKATVSIGSLKTKPKTNQTPHPNKKLHIVTTARV